MTTNIDKYDDIIDSRDVIARIEELQAERDALQEALDEAETVKDEAEAEVEKIDGEEPEAGKANADLARAWELLGEAQSDLDDWDGAAELAILEALAAEGEGSPDWRYGETLIRDSYFRDYAEQLADDIGAIDRNAGWPCTCIDWDQAARELQMDYTAVDFDGVTYWIRS